ncbi:alpha/beta fold hydrolase [Actinoplanes derwentensis]|uniref:Pimeloyl-ACP methyl ester carboxylesterase n=1 Tax=Actinoplanes derwentensis TaxID=113562 RepID=A0A1H1YEJ5_9ACTN|nr:alpha/beta hydrolase [Actinoplanes derwentensis]GID81099.1 alpha/beta hydrolase fold precursor [Actinoplanes derwentensis]SDT19436.1 Pimeloyl-ACP methyl ester carboxylesterase [Actinoplanes derwentensis]
MQSRFVAVGDRRLHARVAGDGAATVVFEAGLGMSGVYWGLVAPVIAQHARTVVYDRAGIAASDDGPRPRTLDRLADDLGALLDSFSGPFVLVGHSYGGPIVRLAASRRPDVHALVLVDPSDERFDEFFTPGTARRMAVAGPVTRILAATGVYRMAARMGSALPADQFARFRTENFGRRAARALHDEVRHFMPGLAALRSSPPDLGDRPLTIVSTGATDGTAPGLRAAHAASAAATPNGRHVVAEGSGHNVMLDRPDLLITEILAALPGPRTP